MLVRLILLIRGVYRVYCPVFFFSLLMKLGGAPLHNWYLKLIQKISWPFIWVLSCWQKVVPLLLLSFAGREYIIPARVVSLVIGRVGAMAQTSLKKIFGLSSIFTLGWILASITTDLNTWLIFLLVYSLNLAGLIACLTLGFSKKNRQTSSQVDAVRLAVFFVFILIIRGIPPFLGFFLKLVIFNQLLTYNFTILLPLILVILRLFIIFVYLAVLFNLIRILNSRTLNYPIKKGGPGLVLDFLIFNTSARPILINFWLCKKLHK